MGMIRFRLIDSTSAEAEKWRIDEKFIRETYENGRFSCFFNNDVILASCLMV